MFVNAKRDDGVDVMINGKHISYIAQEPRHTTVVLVNGEKIRLDITSEELLAKVVAAFN